MYASSSPTASHSVGTCWACTEGVCIVCVIYEKRAIWLTKSHGVGDAADDHDAGNDENEPHCNLIPVFSGRFSLSTKKRNKFEWKSLVIIVAVDVLFVLNEHLDENEIPASQTHTEPFCTHLEIFVPRNQAGEWGRVVYIVTWNEYKSVKHLLSNAEKKQSIKTGRTDRWDAGNAKEKIRRMVGGWEKRQCNLPVTSKSAAYAQNTKHFLLVRIANKVVHR